MDALDNDMPKIGAEYGERSVIQILPNGVLFGKREGQIRNCGAYITSFREWYDYTRTVK